MNTFEMIVNYINGLSNFDAFLIASIYIIFLIIKAINYKLDENDYDHHKGRY